jgi:hypothetical protein
MTGPDIIRTLSKRMTFGDLLDRLNVMEEQLTKLGVNTFAKSRFAKYRRELEKIKSGNFSSVRNTTEALDWLLDCQEFTSSVDELIRAPEMAGLREKIEKAIGGDYSARLGNRQNTPARDTQFELLMAALLRSVGFEIRFDEPDIVIELDNGPPVVVACKRVKHEKNIIQNVRKARDQIKGSGKPGIIALRLAWFELDKPISSIPALSEKTSEFAANISRRLSVDTNMIFDFLLLTSSTMFTRSSSYPANLYLVYLAELLKSKVDPDDYRAFFLEELKRRLEYSNSLVGLGGERGLYRRLGDPPI